MNGWKEIAQHFDKGVRTVQRWEKDLGLPIRRLGTGRGEIVYAFVEELDAWRYAAERRDNLASSPGEEDPQEPSVQVPGLSPAEARGASRALLPAPSPPSTTLSHLGARLSRPLVLVPALLALAALAGLAWWAFAWRAGEPFEARVENHVLRVYDQDGRFLWEHRFGFPVEPPPVVGRGEAAHADHAIADIDGDGLREVLFLTTHARSDAPGGLFCFDGRGNLRFRHVPSPRVQFGRLPSPGPWRPLALTLTPDGNGKAIWVAFLDRDQFPTVVQKLNARNEVTGEFWNPGNVHTLTPWSLRGRAVVLASGVDNEFNGGALAVLDQANPTGTAPALRPKFTCDGCPAGRPLEYLVFPGAETDVRQESNAGIIAVRKGDRDELVLVVAHIFCPSFFGKPGACIAGETHFILDANLRPLSAQQQPDYRVLHGEAYRLGLVDHPFGPADDAALAVLRWNGSGFDTLRPGATP